jgi:hypothetical protein
LTSRFPLKKRTVLLHLLFQARVTAPAVPLEELPLPGRVSKANKHGQQLQVRGSYRPEEAVYRGEGAQATAVLMMKN